MIDQTHPYYRHRTRQIVDLIMDRAIDLAQDECRDDLVQALIIISHLIDYKKAKASRRELMEALRLDDDLVNLIFFMAQKKNEARRIIGFNPRVIDGGREVSL